MSSQTSSGTFWGCSKSGFPQHRFVASTTTTGTKICLLILRFKRKIFEVCSTRLLAPSTTSTKTSASTLSSTTGSSFYRQLDARKWRSDYSQHATQRRMPKRFRDTSGALVAPKARMHPLQPAPALSHEDQGGLSPPVSPRARMASRLLRRASSMSATRLSWPAAKRSPKNPAQGDVGQTTSPPSAAQHAAHPVSDPGERLRWACRLPDLEEHGASAAPDSRRGMHTTSPLLKGLTMTLMCRTPPPSPGKDFRDPSRLPWGAQRWDAGVEELDQVAETSSLSAGAWSPDSRARVAAVAVCVRVCARVCPVCRRLCVRACVRVSVSLRLRLCVFVCLCSWRE